MKIRRYLANNTQEAILKVKMDLGNDALILNTRKVRKKGVFSIFSKPMVEVLAAIDENYDTINSHDMSKRDESSILGLKNDKSKTVSNVKNGVEGQKIHHLENKVENMEALLNKIYEQVQKSSSKSIVDIDQKQCFTSNILQNFYNNLIRNEVDIEIAKKIIEMVHEKVGQNTSVNESAMVLGNILTGVLGKPETMQLKNDGKPTVAILIGPTGVGKTTTLAKIAANYSLNFKKNVGLITADTYRISAVEQLKTYAEILGIPITVIYSSNEVQEAINNYSDKDLILIDTAGRSHRNKEQFEELKTLVNLCNADEIYLVLSATTSTKNCRDILGNYGFLKDYKLIFTKIDEAPVPGIVLNSRFTTGKKLSYITTGQSVPDDIEVANIEKLTKMLMGSLC